MFAKVPLALLGLSIGSVLTVVGFVAYATGNSTLNLAGFFYGIPLLLGGLALKAAELKPIAFSVPTSKEILTLRKTQATATQKQIIRDITRYRYGQEAHLDEALQKVGLRPTDEERPVLISLRETTIDGRYSLILEFDSPLVSLESWQERKEKIEKFFGPGIVVKIEQVEQSRIDLSMIALDLKEK
jgi:hypothetical protein